MMILVLRETERGMRKGKEKQRVHRSHMPPAAATRSSSRCACARRTRTGGVQRGQSPSLQVVEIISCQPVAHARRGSAGGSHPPSPACAVEVLAGRSNRERQALYLGRQSRDPREGHVEQAVVDLVRDDQDVVLDAQVPILCSSSRVKTLPRGLLQGLVSYNVHPFRGKARRGVLRTIIFVLGVMDFSSTSKSMVHSPADRVSSMPVLGGCIGTYTILAPGISMLLMYCDS